MKTCLILGLVLALPCAGDPAGPAAPSAPPPAAAPSAEAPPADGAQPTANAPPGTGLDNVRTVTIDPNARPPVCRRVVPTGSRIAEQRCESPRDRPTAADEADRDALRRDFQALRDQQMMRDQAREAAMAEALRRGRGR